MDKEVEFVGQGLDVMREAFEEILWMAIRYAHGRQTAAPGIVRKAIEDVRRVFPDFKVKKDSTIEPPTKNERESIIFVKGDYLNDLFDEEECQHYRYHVADDRMGGEEFVCDDCNKTFPKDPRK